MRQLSIRSVSPALARANGALQRRQDSPDLLASRFSDSIFRPQDFLIRPNAAANLDLFAEPDQVYCFVHGLRGLRSPRHDVECDGFDDTFAMIKNVGTSEYPFMHRSRRQRGENANEPIGVERERSSP